MQKTIFTALVGGIVLASLAGGGEFSDADWAQLKSDAVNRKRLLIYDNDSDDALNSDKDSTVEEFYKQRTSYLAGSQVDTLVYNAEVGAFCNLLMPLPPTERPPFVKEGGFIARLHKNGTDPVQLELDFARKNKIEFFAGIRINDTHDALNPQAEALLLPECKRQHPEWLWGSKLNRPPFGDWSSFDFDRPEVRALFVDTVKKIVDRYEVDGVAIDFFRQVNLFASVGHGGKASDVQRKEIVEMMREIRRYTEKVGRERHRPILIAMRIPDSVEYCRGIGLDVEGILGDKLVDLVIAAGNFRLNPWEYSVELCKKYGVKCYASIDMPQFDETSRRLFRNGDASHYARIAQALTAGVDGTYWFNRFYQHAVEQLMVPDLAGLKLLSKRYFITDRFLYYTPEHHLRGGSKLNHLPMIHPSSPVELNPDQPMQFILEFGDDLETLTSEGGTYEIGAVLQGKLPSPEALRIESNGVRWPYRGMDGDFYNYSVPAGALKPGINSLEITYEGRGGNDSEEEILMSGCELLEGARQAPWRRLFPVVSAADGPTERIVENSYCLADNGKGYANLLYPLPPVNGTLQLKCSMRLGNSSGEQGAIVRIADGRHVEIISFQPGKIKCLFSGKEVPFDPQDRFHDYEFDFGETQLGLLADGKELLTAPLTMAADAGAGMLTGYDLAIPFMSERSILIGSLENAGGGVSYWRDLSMNRLRGRVFLEDFAVELDIFRPLRETEVKRWRFQQNSGAPILTGTHPSWSPDPMVAEIDVNFDALPVRLAVSCGSDLAMLDVSKSRIAFPYGARGPLELPELHGTHPIRVEFDGSNRVQLFCGDSAREFSAQNVTETLRDSAFESLTPMDRAVLRNSGVTVLADSQGRRNVDAVSAIRATIRPGGDAFFSDDKINWRVVFDAAQGELPGAQWLNSYPAGVARVVADDGSNVLRLEGNRGVTYAFQYADPAELAQWGREVVIAGRMRYRKGVADDKGTFFTVGLVVPDSKQSASVFLAFGTDGIAGNCGATAWPEVASGAFFDFSIWLDTETGAAKIWIDNELALTRAAVPGPVLSPLLFLGKTGVDAGVVEISSFKAGNVK